MQYGILDLIDLETNKSYLENMILSMAN